MAGERDDVPLTPLERALVRALVRAVVGRGVVRAGTATDEQSEVALRTQSTGGGMTRPLLGDER